jgi:hypothetical protein
MRILQSMRLIRTVKYLAANYWVSGLQTANLGERGGKRAESRCQQGSQS